MWGGYPSHIQLSRDRHKQVRKLWIYGGKYLKKNFSGWRQKRHESKGNVIEIESVIGTWTTVASFKYGGKETGDRGCGWPLEAKITQGREQEVLIYSSTELPANDLNEPGHVFIPRASRKEHGLAATLSSTKHRINQVTWDTDFWPVELWCNKWLLVWDATFVVICYDSNRKQIPVETK